MKVLLNENVDKLGELGDIVEVKAGFARNFLLPKKLAVLPSKHNIEIMKFKKVKYQKKLELEKLSAMEQKTKLEELTLTIPKKAGENEQLFGSVTTMEIGKHLEEQGVTVDRKRIHLDEPIKKLGTHHCIIRLMEGIDAEVKIEVVQEAEADE